MGELEYFLYEDIVVLYSFCLLENCPCFTCCTVEV